MNALLGLSPDFPILYVIPIVVFGPVFVMILYHLGLKEIIRPSPEAREHSRKLKQQENQAKNERQKKLTDSGLAGSKIIISPLQWLGQGVTYVLFALVIAWFSSSPAYQYQSPEMAEVRLSLTHPGQRIAECRKRSRQELQKLPANMRAPMSCSRERWPLTVELELDGKLVFQGVARPTGLSSDGHSSFYERFPVVGKSHKIAVRLWDGDGKDKADYTLEKEITLSPSEILVIGFDNGTRQLTLR